MRLLIPILLLLSFSAVSASHTLRISASIEYVEFSGMSKGKVFFLPENYTVYDDYQDCLGKVDLASARVVDPDLFLYLSTQKKPATRRNPLLLTLEYDCDVKTEVFVKSIDVPEGLKQAHLRRFLEAPLIIRF